MFFKSTPNVFQKYSKCTSKVLQMYIKSTSNVLQKRIISTKNEYCKSMLKVSPGVFMLIRPFNFVKALWPIFSILIQRVLEKCAKPPNTKNNKNQKLVLLNILIVKFMFPFSGPLKSFPG